MAQASLEDEDEVLVIKVLSERGRTSNRYAYNNFVFLDMTFTLVTKL